MIRLENISTNELYNYLKKEVLTTPNKKEYLDAMYIIINNYVKNYKDLKELIETGNLKYQNRLLINALEVTKIKIKEENKQKLTPKPEIYITENYKNTSISKKSIKLSENNKGSVLIYQNPTKTITPKTKQLGSFTINEIKFMLSHLNANLTNEFKELNSNFNSKDIEQLLISIEFFEKQIIRQYNDIKEIYNITEPIDVFKFNQPDKIEILEPQLKEIAEYLIDNGSNYIWGPLTDRQKKMLLKSTVSQRTYEDKYINKNLIDIISNYTTQSELEEGLTKKRTLNRFIINN